MPAPKTRRPLYFACSTGAPRMHCNLGGAVEECEIDTNFQAVECGLILGIEKARIALGHDRSLAEPMDGCAGKLHNPVTLVLWQERFCVRPGEQHGMAEVPA